MKKREYLLSLICESVQQHKSAFLHQIADSHLMSDSLSKQWSEFVGEIDDHIKLATACEMSWDEEISWEELLGQK